MHEILTIVGPFENVLSTKVEEHLDNMWDDSVYVGPPSKKLDDAWHEHQRGRQQALEILFYP
jgi:hypothetical protein